MTDNPSFAGVHPSLVSELNVFNGLIKRQLANAYEAGGEVFGGEPMVVDGQDGGGGGGVHHRHQPTQMHVVRQHHQHQQQQPQQVMYQPDYQGQHFDKQEAKRLEREREEAASREMERQEMERHEAERQELARQQQLHQQREMKRQRAHEQEIQRQQQYEILRQQQQAQQEVIQQQQQLDIRRQREKQQQQEMQDQYRQQLEVQQHQLQQRQSPQYPLQGHHYDQENQPPMLTESDHGMVPSSSSHPAAPTVLTLSHSQSQPNIHQAYQQRSQHHYQPMHHPDAAGGLSSYALPPLAQQRVPQRVQQSTRYSNLAQQPQQQQHSMYPVPPEYSSPDSYVPPTPISTTSSSSSYIPYWSAASNSFTMPDQQATSASTAGYGSSTAIPRTQTSDYQHQQYTPEGALRGIAADDRSLQETWQSYMNKVFISPNPQFCILLDFG